MQKLASVKNSKQKTAKIQHLLTLKLFFIMQIIALSCIIKFAKVIS